MSTYTSLMNQIAALKRDADKARKAELSGIIKTIKAQIKKYELTASDLGLVSSTSLGISKNKSDKGQKVPTKAKAMGRRVAVKYRDGAGNKWTGRGRQPAWVRNFLSQGGDLSSLKVSSDG